MLHKEENQLQHMVDNFKPLMLTAFGLSISFHDILSSTALLLSIAYTSFKFYNDYKNKNKNEP